MKKHPTRWKASKKSLVVVQSDFSPETAVENNSHQEQRDLLRIYLAEASKTPLLTPHEERALAIRNKKGDKKAREGLIKANLRLVIKIAREYENRGVPLLDLIQEGNIGLIKAIERYDPKKGAKVSTYASWWIKQKIFREIPSQGKVVNLPIHIIQKLTKMNRVSRELEKTLNREPSNAEIGAELGMSEKSVEQIYAANITPTSLDLEIGEGGLVFGELIPDSKAADPSAMIENQDHLELLREILKELEPRERKIISLRFGLNQKERQTLEEIGVALGVTRERIRQVQNIALHKLRVSFKKRTALQKH